MKNDAQRRRIEYESKLRELRYEPSWTPSMITSTHKTSTELELELNYKKIKESEDRIKFLEEKNREELYMSPSKRIIHKQLED